MAERVFVALDLETTGLDSNRDAIIEIGAVRFCGNEILDRFATFVHPQRPIPLRVQQITAITDRDVAGAPSIDLVAPELLAFVDGSVDAVIAHNAPFDLGFLQRAGIHFHRPALDTHELSSIVLPGMSSYSLGELCRQLNITLPQAHRALDDAEAAARLFMHVRERVEQLPRAILRALIECAADSAWGPLILFRDALDISAKETVWSGADLAHIADGMPLAAAVQGHVTHVPPTTVTRAFAADGPLAQLMDDGYEERHGQVDMAQTVLQALNQGGHQIIEAGTGTGKSMAYLLAVWAQANGQRVVIASGTITLQEQLIDQRSARRHDRRAECRSALLRGHSHYLHAASSAPGSAAARLTQLELRAQTHLI
ncbi:MAG: exonuclease domain-containing protein [Caldilineaceae bacterium]